MEDPTRDIGAKQVRDAIEASYLRKLGAPDLSPEERADLEAALANIRSAAPSDRNRDLDRMSDDELRQIISGKVR